MRRRARLRTRSRFVLAFLGLGLAVMAVAVASIYRAVGAESAERSPAEAEALLAAAAERALDGSVDPSLRLAEAADSLIAARALLARGRVLGRDSVVGLALSVAAIVGAVLGAASLAFAALSRVLAREIDSLAAGVLRAQGEAAFRLPPSSDPDLDKVRRALNDLLDLSAEQALRLAEAARLDGWRETASFLAHQLKNPLAALLLAARNLSTALAGGDGSRGRAAATSADPLALSDSRTDLALARDCARVVRDEGERLRSLIDRFRGLAPAALESRDLSATVDLGALIRDCAARAGAAGAAVSVVAARGSAGPGGRDPAGEAEGPALPGPFVVGDRALLEQAFWNLFANSLEAGEGKASMTVRISAGGGRAAVSLADSNRLADPALVSRLGRERITTKKGGTGLGLVLVRRIIAAMGGTIAFSATEADGLGIEVALPLERTER